MNLSPFLEIFQESGPFGIEKTMVAKVISEPLSLFLEIFQESGPFSIEKTMVAKVISEPLSLFLDLRFFRENCPTIDH